MLDQYRVQMANLERISKQNMDFIESTRANTKSKKPAAQQNLYLTQDARQAKQQHLKSTVELGHAGAGRARQGEEQHRPPPLPVPKDEPVRFHEQPVETTAAQTTS